jgi:hypothetical protein
MATKAERARAEEQRSHRAANAKKKKPHVAEKKPRKGTWSHEKAHAGSKATHALEDTAAGKRPSRESTRGSSNRAKADAAMNVTEETRKGSPTNRARKSRTRVIKVRGGSK